MESDPLMKPPHSNNSALPQIQTKTTIRSPTQGLLKPQKEEFVLLKQIALIVTPLLSFVLTLNFTTFLIHTHLVAVLCFVLTIELVFVLLPLLGGEKYLN